MKHISRFRYENNGITIVFEPAPLKERTEVQKYSFSVECDKDLTEKLRNSVKRKEVKEDAIFYCAKALFEIIQKGEFKKIAVGKEITAFFRAFEDVHGEIPQFTVTPHGSGWKAELTNFSKSLWGIGRTKQDAKVEAIKASF